MEKLGMNPTCLACLVSKQLSLPESAGETVGLQYLRSMLRLAADAPDELTAPELNSMLDKLRIDTFGEAEDYTERKSRFNRLMLSLEPELADAVAAAPDSLRRAVGFAVAANYIDFHAVESVDESALRSLLYGDVNIDGGAYDYLCRELARAKQLVYLTDNCGEIVADKLLLAEIRALHPQLAVTIIVRGGDAAGDATLPDALEVGLDKLAPVISNGTRVAGTPLRIISAEARAALENADLIISKGQGNFETLCGSGLNIVYLFLCKCNMFAARFNVPRCTGMVLAELDDVKKSDAES